jgi:hypothetical protein
VTDPGILPSLAVRVNDNRDLRRSLRCVDFSTKYLEATGFDRAVNRVKTRGAETRAVADSLARPDLSRPLETLFRVGVVGDLSHEELLRRFVIARGDGDQAAFTLLVERYGPMVLRLCREVLGNQRLGEVVA